VATIRKKREKWCVEIRRSFHKHLSKSFITKQDAQRWARETERFHCTRATFCTRAAEDNWQLLDIAAQTGHKDVNVLRKHYAKM
jgi:integrase